MKGDEDNDLVLTVRQSTCMAVRAQTNPEDGLTLRDYFAARALTGVLTGAGLSDSADVADLAYTYADAMLKRRLR